MVIETLRLRDFRNLADAVLEPGTGVNILFGKNAHGKTNLLEAIWLFTGAKSFRGARDPEMIGFGKKTAKASLRFLAGGRDNTAEIAFLPSRNASLNGVSLKSAGELSGEFRAVVFSPEHLSLVKGPPRNRRRMIDTAICQLWPKHAALLREYARALMQRNALFRFPGPAADTADVWEDRLCALGAQITVARLRYARRLRKKASDFYTEISGGAEHFTFRYVDGEGNEIPSETDGKIRTTAEINTRLKETFAKNRRKDEDAGYISAGPHRDDLELTIDGMASRLYASQGQQRSAALSLKMAEAAILNEQTSEPPVLLLDDVMSELDPSRQEVILKNTQGWQVFITCCEPAALNSFGGRLFQIKNGNVVPQ